MENNNHIIILVGVCGTGKSAVGLKVAQRLEVPFFDVDKLTSSKRIMPEGNPSTRYGHGKMVDFR